MKTNAAAKMTDATLVAHVGRFVDYAAGQAGMFSAAQAAMVLGVTEAFWSAVMATETRDGNLVYCGGPLYRVAR